MKGTFLTPLPPNPLLPFRLREGEEGDQWGRRG